MNTLGERLYFFRTQVVRKTRKDFGPPVGMTESELKNVEYGKTTIREDKLLLICDVYGIREEWLREGIEPMCYPKSLGDEIGEIAAAASKHKPEEAANYFRHLFDGWSEGEILMLYELMRRKFPEHFPDSKK